MLAVTPSNNMGSVPGWQTAHNGAIATLKKENDRSGSPIEGRIDTARMGMVGFSKGGGGVTMAADANVSGIAATVALCPYYGDAPGSPGGKIKTPIFYLTGTADTIASPAGVESAYGRTPNATKKLFVKYSGMSHFDMYGSDSAIKAKTANQIVSFLKVFVTGNDEYMTYLKGDKFQQQKGNFSGTKSNL